MKNGLKLYHLIYQKYIPSKSIAEAAASLIQDKYSKKLDSKYKTCVYA